MGLSPGERLGPYEVVGAIGAGGMGQVYRARDTRLGRDVALKILPDEFTHDTERLARFQREAQVLAALNHPHIATIHGVEDAGGTPALVMELIDGVTLEEHLAAARGPLDLSEAIAIARQIATALEAAHERGIIHRDLKPANIKLREDRAVKVLDFGLAKATSAIPLGDIANSPTLTAPAMTAHGVLLGTAAYMSPEQARGRAVDKRADIWAFGVVFYEMLTGGRLFAGASTTDVIAQVLTAEPDWNALGAVPPVVRKLLKRCLTKDPSSRLRDIGEARIVLADEAVFHGPSEDCAAAGATPSFWRRSWPLGATALIGIVVGFVGGQAGPRMSSVAPPGITTRTSIAIPATQTLSNPRTMTLALSADGARLVYKARVGGTDRLFLRDMHVGGEAREIPGTERADTFAFSPDATWLVFTIGRGSMVKKVQLSGGAPMQLCSCTVETGILWASDGFVYFAVWQDKKWSFRKMPESGGPASIVPVPPEYDARQLTHPAPLPGGRRLLVVVSDPNGGEIVAPSIAAYDLETHAVTPLVARGMSPRYLPTGHLLFASGSVLYALAFDAATLKVTGQPAPVVEHVTTAGRFAYADYAVADKAGTLVYSAAPFARTRVVRFRGDQAPEGVLDPQGYLDLALSPDGKQLAVTIDPRGIPALPLDSLGMAYRGDLYTRFEPNGELTRRAYGEIRRPVFLPGGARLAFGSGPLSQRVISVGERESALDTLVKGTDRFPFRPSSVSPDGTRLAYDHNGNIYVVPLQGDPKPEELLKSRTEQRHPVFSADGRWMAYDLSDGQGGPADIWVRPYPSREPAVQVSTSGGILPRWSPDGRRVYFVGLDGGLMAADVIAARDFRASAPRMIAPKVAGIRAFALAPDGETFYAIVDERPGPAPKRDVTVVTGWFEEVRRLVNPAAPR